ncbi:TIGR03936 family radical SAM-associated protein, partial [Candidatus Dependentiae bacterium]|nr:TIGR03936 family radical SAM-associated protein [Candidatus Dependentiae bacterium]
IEIMRGCVRGCRFCLAGYINRPVRTVDSDEIMNTACGIISKTGINSLTLSSLSSSDYPDIDYLLTNIIPELDKNKIAVSVPSLRADTLNRLISYNLNETKRNSITIAPEAGSLRMRKKINKNLSDEDIDFALKLAIDRGYQTIKLYFMLGLPDETIEDIDGIVSIVKSLLFYGKRKIKRIRVSLSVFTPKPHTPLQWCSYASYEEFNEKIKYLCSKLKYEKIELIWHSYYSGLVESVISRGGKLTNEIIFNAFNNGAKMDNWTEYFKFDYWDNAIRQSGADYKLLTKSIDINSFLPWDFIDIGVKKSFLKEEYFKFLNGEQIDDCRISGCNGCSDYLDCSNQIIINKKEKCGTNSSIVETNQDKSISAIGKNDENLKYVYRMVYIKSYKLKFISHLDLQKLLLTSLKFAGLKMKYSQGFNKKPLIEFSGALSLGFISLSEIIDVTLETEIDCEKVRKQLNLFFNKNLLFKSIFKLNDKKQSISESIEQNIYNIVLYKNSGISYEKIKNISESKITVLKKDRNKIIDLKEFVSEFSIKTLKNFDIVTIKIKNNRSGSVNPFQIIKDIVDNDSIKDIIKTGSEFL